MSERPPFTELAEAPASGRVFRRPLRPGLADVIGDGRDGRARMDAIARWLQDIAFLDLVDAGFQGRGAWLVRRTRIRVERFPALRRGARAGHLLQWHRALLRRAPDLDPGRERPLSRGSHSGSAWTSTAGSPCACRRTSSPPTRRAPPGAGRRCASATPIPRRRRGPPRGRGAASDLDLAGHVNNSHYWSPLEERLAGVEPERIDAEVEHRSAAQPGRGAHPLQRVRPLGDRSGRRVQASLLSDA
jgi:hypothetical protein